MARKSSLKQPIKLKASQSIGRRVSIVMTSDPESDESLVIVPRSSVSNAAHKKITNPPSRNSSTVNKVKKVQQKLSSNKTQLQSRSSISKSNNKISHVSDEKIVVAKKSSGKSNKKVSKFSGVVRYRKINFLYGVLEFMAYGLRRFLRPQFSSLSLFLRCFLRHLFIAILGRISSKKSSQMSCFPENNRPIVQKASFSTKNQKIF